MLSLVTCCIEYRRPKLYESRSGAENPRGTEKGDVVFTGLFLFSALQLPLDARFSLCLQAVCVGAMPSSGAYHCLP